MDSSRDKLTAKVREQRELIEDLEAQNAELLAVLEAIANYTPHDDGTYVIDSSDLELVRAAIARAKDKRC
jgi:hypothetical protein